MKIHKNQFCPDILNNLTPNERDTRLAQLEEIINNRLPTKISRDVFLAELENIINELKAMGHDIWSWDYDGVAGGIWGGDYMKPEKMGKLIIEFVWGGHSKVNWDYR